MYEPELIDIPPTLFRDSSSIAGNDEEEEQLAYGNNWNWSSCFSDWQRHNFYSLEDGTQSTGCGSSLGKMEDFSLGEEQHDNYFSYHEDTANQFVSDYNPWCAYGGEEDSHDYGRQHPRTKYGYNLDDLVLHEGIFGYWPFLSREKSRITRSVEHRSAEIKQISGRGHN
nr:hypothetical protein CFP56_50010 [Quercus suber]